MSFSFLSFEEWVGQDDKIVQLTGTRNQANTASEEGTWCIYCQHKMAWYCTKQALREIPSESSTISTLG